MKALRVRPTRRLPTAAAAIVVGLLAVWAARHVMSLASMAHGGATPLTLIFAVAFGLLAWTMLLSFGERPYRVNAVQAAGLRRLNVVVQVPAYNEDPAALRACLRSLLAQTRRPTMVCVVDDGSTVAYGNLRTWFKRRARAAGVIARWDRMENAGKRHAQGHTFSTTPDADIYVTVDSDAVLAPDALEEGLKPFADARVMSVAGVVVAMNLHRNLLTRMTDLWFVTGQLIDRSAMSRMGSVLVNSGPLALYRAALIRDNLDGYLNETFAGRAVEFSDDSMLTIYALERGRAVQQPTAFAFTLMPERLSHHLRQYLRWMRGATIRSVWRFRYLPLNSYAFWGHLIGWTQMLMGAVVFVALFVVQPVIDWRILPTLLLIPVLVGYGQSLRYLSFSRSDTSFGSQLVTVLLTPIATMWAFFVLRAVRWYGMATCLRTGWGTRQDVEVSLR